MLGIYASTRIDLQMLSRNIRQKDSRTGPELLFGIRYLLLRARKAAWSKLTQQDCLYCARVPERTYGCCCVKKLQHASDIWLTAVNNSTRD